VNMATAGIFLGLLGGSWWHDNKERTS
jgi:hypothetical protein